MKFPVPVPNPVNVELHKTNESSRLPRLRVVVPTYVNEFDAVVGDGVEGDGDVLQLVVLVLRTLVVPSGDGGDDDSHLLSQL